MRLIYQFIGLAPSVLFFIGFIISVLNLTHGSCHHGGVLLQQWEMPAMWLIMFFAHLTPWLLWYQNHFTRNR